MNNSENGIRAWSLKFVFLPLSFEHSMVWRTLLMTKLLIYRCIRHHQQDRFRHHWINWIHDCCICVYGNVCIAYGGVWNMEVRLGQWYQRFWWHFSFKQCHFSLIDIDKTRIFWNAILPLLSPDMRSLVSSLLFHYYLFKQLLTWKNWPHFRICENIEYWEHCHARTVKIIIWDWNWWENIQMYSMPTNYQSDTHTNKRRPRPWNNYNGKQHFMNKHYNCEKKKSIEINFVCNNNYVLKYVDPVDAFDWMRAFKSIPYKNQTSVINAWKPVIVLLSTRFPLKYKSRTRFETSLYSCGQHRSKWNVNSDWMFMVQ